MVGVSILQGAWVDADAERALLVASRKADDYDGEPVAELRVHTADGQRLVMPIRYGIHTLRPDVDPRGWALWATAGAVRGQSPELAALGSNGADRVLFRLDWLAPEAAVDVEAVELVVLRAGVHMTVADVVALLP